MLSKAKKFGTIEEKLVENQREKGVFVDIFFTTLVTIAFITNLLFALLLVFMERNDARSTWAWLMVLFFIPLLGFVLYLVFGQNLTRERLFNWEGQKKIKTGTLYYEQLEAFAQPDFSPLPDENPYIRQLIRMNLQVGESPLTTDNEIQIFHDGNEKFNALLNDIESAKDHIHLQYYIYRKDSLGKKILESLILKAQEGVKIKVLFDDTGSRTTTKRFFKELLILNNH